MPTLQTCSTRRRRAALALWLSGAGCVLVALLSLTLGPAALGPRELLEAVAQPASTAGRILRYVRLPRTLAALLTGSALAVAGAVLQAVLDNALAAPNIIGVNAGAGLGGLLLLALFPSHLRLTPLFSFLGAFASAMGVYLLARRGGASRVTIALAGVAVSSFLGSLTDAVLTFFPETQAQRIAFMIGGFSGVSLQLIAPAALAILVGLALCFGFSYEINLLTLGGDTAASLGLRTGLVRLLLLAASALLAGSAVSLAGLLGFVGLIVPHAARFLAGQDHRTLLPLCALLGAGFTLACDLMARLLFAPYELPVGVVLSFLGGPFFLYLLLRRGRGRLL